MIAGIAKRANDEGVTPLEYIINWIESGRTFVQLASGLSKESDLDITAQQVRRYADKLAETGNEGAGEAIARARLIGAHSLVEGAIEIADNAGATREEIAKAKLQVDTRLWTAERWNQRDLGQQKGVTVAISLPGLHLDAMRARATAVASVSPAVSAPLQITGSQNEEVAEVVDTE
jgi:hypothetical protein